MKRLARSLIRLYPRAWRARYGEEFNALIEDAPPGASTAFDLFKGAVQMQLSVRNFPRLALLLSIAGLLIGLGGSFLITPRYTSSSELAISDVGESSHTALDHLMQTEQQVLSRTTLSNIIMDPRVDLYAEERARLPLEDVIETMRTRDIRIRLIDRPDKYPLRYAACVIEFTSSDPNIARKVNQILIIRFQEANDARQRTSPVRVGRDTEVSQLEGRIAVLEQRLGIASTPPHFDERLVVPLNVIDPPSLPTYPRSPNRPMFMGAGFGGRFVLAIAVAMLRRPIPHLPQPA